MSFISRRFSSFPFSRTWPTVRPFFLKRELDISSRFKKSFEEQRELYAVRHRSDVVLRSSTSNKYPDAWARFARNVLRIIFSCFNRAFCNLWKFNLDFDQARRLPSTGYRITWHFPLTGQAGNGRLATSKAYRLDPRGISFPSDLIEFSRGFNLVRFTDLRYTRYRVSSALLPLSRWRRTTSRSSLELQGFSNSIEIELNDIE